MNANIYCGKCELITNSLKAKTTSGRIVYICKRCGGRTYNG